MADSFDKNQSQLWAALTGQPSPRPRSLADLVPPPVTPMPGGIFGTLLGTPTFGSSLAPQVAKRRAFFSFHYDDIMRVNNVRLCGEFAKSSTDNGRKIEGFYDKSLWEPRKLDGPESIKNLIRDGVKNSSAVCVLIGTETWARRWVRYEIARAIVDGKGLLAVHINTIKHHKLLVPHMLGPNPLDYIGVCKRQQTLLGAPTYYLYERKQVLRGSSYVWEWHSYADYTHAVDRPQWLADPQPGYVMPLSINTSIHNFSADDGYRNIGGWIDAAAVRAGR